MATCGFTLYILALPQRLISFWPARLSPVPSACRVTFSHLAYAAVRFLWCLATSTDPSTFAMQIATGGEVLPSLHEFMAIRAVPLGLAWVQNCGVRSFYYREIAFTLLRADQ